MALKGDLRDFNVTQLLNLINLARKTGTLIVESPVEIISICFREGQLAYAQDGTENDNLISILFRFNKISAAQQRSLNDRLGHMNDKELGLTLVNANYLEQGEILACMQVYFTDILKQLCAWVEGLFCFEADRPPPRDKITVRVSLENIILETARRLQENERLQDEIPDLEMALRFTSRPGVKMHELNLSASERRVLPFINSKNSMLEIARLSQLNDLEIRQVTYSLLQTGMIEIVWPEGARQPLPVFNRATRPLVPAPAQKSLIYRLINRIRAI